jgi:hypothetical protein
MQVDYISLPRVGKTPHVTLVSVRGVTITESWGAPTATPDFGYP